MPKTRSKKSSKVVPVARKPKTARSKPTAKAEGPRKAAAAPTSKKKRPVAKTAARAVNGSARLATPAAESAPPAAKKKPTSGKRKKAASRPLAAVVTDALEDMKAHEINCLDVRHLTSVTDTMVIAGGRSDRHVRALADAVVERAKAAGVTPIGVEGHDAGEWVLVDLADVVVHVMLPRVREFYNLERLWDFNAREEAVER